MARPDEIVLLKQGLENLGKSLLRGEGGELTNNQRRQISRAIPAAITQQDELFADQLQQVPAALQQADLGDFNQARKVLTSIAGREGRYRNKSNWGPDNEAHHTLELIGQYLVAGKLSMRQAEDFYKLAQQEGIPLGTLREHLLSVTEPGHQVAHTNIRTNKQGTKGSSEQTAALIEAQKPQNIDKRLELWIPKAQQEIENSVAGYSTVEEQQVRDFAANLAGIHPRQLDIGRVNRQASDVRAGDDVTRAERIKSVLSSKLTEAGLNLQDEARRIYSEGNAEIAIPKVELITPTRGRNQGVTRAVEVADERPGLMEQRIVQQRPEEQELLSYLRKPLGY